MVTNSAGSVTAFGFLVGEIASIDRGWLPFSQLEIINNDIKVGEIASIDRGWLLMSLPFKHSSYTTSEKQPRLTEDGYNFSVGWYNYVRYVSEKQPRLTEDGYLQQASCVD